MTKITGTLHEDQYILLIKCCSVLPRTTKDSNIFIE